MCDIYESGVYKGEEFNKAARHAADWLVKNQQEDGSWPLSGHNAPGFPKVFYLKYTGYSTYFPLWALSRYLKVFKFEGLQIN
jgi:squalene-hopene/tetraprenyl-beta-curcumene cyclase